eukprot:m.132389 g.132389  ORF g.132389 m.132389 type:complete len:333 (+) comp11333_c0_seq2:444-1442(+)
MGECGQSTDGCLVILVPLSTFLQSGIIKIPDSALTPTQQCLRVPAKRSSRPGCHSNCRLYCTHCVVETGTTGIMALEMPLLTVRDVRMYQIPPRTTNKGYRADAWGLDKPAWTGILRIVSKGSECLIRLVDKQSGDLFVQCPVDKFPGLAVEACTDSSRYFVIRALDEASGQHAFVGIGFTERSDAFDFNVALSDHFKHEKASTDAAKAADEPYVAKHELGGLSGPIKINLKTKSGSDTKKKSDDGGFAGLQAPPGLWGSSGPPKAAAAPTAAPAASNPFGDTNPFAAATTPGGTPANPFAAAPEGGDGWGDFSAPAAPAASSDKGTDWVQF